MIIPPFTALSRVSERLSRVENVRLGAQNMHWEKPGAFTGEISVHLLRELFVRYVVVGHSERRALFGETDEIVNKKAHAALEASMRPIVCIGETLAEREAGKVEEVLERQLAGSLAGLGVERTRRSRDRLRTGLGDRHRADGHSGTGAGSPRLYPQATREALRCGDRGQGPHPIRRQCETRQHRRFDVPTRHRRSARGRGEPRSPRLRGNREDHGRRAVAGIAVRRLFLGSLIRPALRFERKARRSQAVGGAEIDQFRGAVQLIQEISEIRTHEIFTRGPSSRGCIS